MPKFRKKPVEVEAFDPWNMDDAPDWFSNAVDRGDIWFQGGSEPYYTIKTLEGDMRAIPGDWIVKGVSGELYPVKPGIFAATYERVNQE